MELFDLLINILEFYLILYFTNQLLNIKLNKLKMWIFVIGQVIIFEIITNYLIYEGFFDLLFILIVYIYISSYKLNSNFYEEIYVTFLPITVIMYVNNLILDITVLIKNDNVINILNNSYIYIFLVIISKIIFVLIMQIIVKYRKNYDTYFKEKEGLYLAFSIIILHIISIVLGFYQLLNINYIVYNLILNASLALFLINNIVSFINILKDKDILKNMELNSRIIESENKRYTDLMKVNEETKQIKHNFKHILIPILLNIEKGKTEDAIKLINETQSSLDTMDRIHITNDSVLDYHLNILNKNIQKDITLKCNYNIVNKRKIKDKDFSVLIGNLFENAIEHCSGNNKRINISIHNINEYYKIEIENTINNDVDLDYMQSSKKSNNHGYGISTIKEIVKNNDGFIDFKLYENMFKVSILLPTC